MDHAETVAKLILEAAMPGAVMEFRSDQSHMEYDFHLRHPNGEVAAVEATSSMDQARMRTNAEIFGKKKGGSSLSVAECKKSWLIFPAANALIKEVRKKADKYLARLEAEGLEEFDILRWHSSPECVRSVCGDLNLISGMVFSSTGAQPEIRIAGVGGGGAVGASTATEAGERETDANRKKLGQAKTDDRHLVVYIDPRNGLPWTALTSFEPPPFLPSLPDEITHIWLVTEDEKAGQFVVWYGSRKDSWRKVVFPQTNVS